MKITALAPWYGSKRTLAPRIVRELGRHKSYVEPFCGSMAVLLKKPRSSMETVNDLHGDLINLARVLANETAAIALYTRASRVLMHEELQSECRQAVFESDCEPAPSIEGVTPEHTERALRYLVMSWQGRNGSAGTRITNITPAKRYTHNGGTGGLRWQNAVESIPDWHHRIRAVQIFRMDAIELLGRIGDQDGATIYVDPPYVKKSDKYVHDLDRDDHARLSDALRRFEHARVVVSYYDHPLVRELYDGWTVVECPVAKSLANQGKRDRPGATVAPEILLINGESYTSGDGRLFA